MLNHDNIKTFAAQGLGLECTEIKRLTRGGFHEIFVLHFRRPDDDTASVPFSLAKAGFTCIARFTRETDEDGKDESELAAIRYLAERTKLPLSGIYAIDLSPNNDMDAPCVLMERLPGQHVYNIWGDLSLERKKAVISQIAFMVVELASVRFDKIGCLNEDGEIGALITSFDRPAKCPMNNYLEYIKYYLDPDQTSHEDLQEIYRKVGDLVEKHLEGNHHPMFGPSFPMIDADFDGQNILFTLPKDGSPPQLSGLIDLERAHSGTFYELYECPMFIQDNHMDTDAFAANAVLRPRFVSEIVRLLPTSDARELFIETMNAKNWILNSFHTNFTGRWAEELVCYVGERMLKQIEEGKPREAYDGRMDVVIEIYGQDGLPVKHREGWFSKQVSRRAPAIVTKAYRWLPDVAIGLTQRCKATFDILRQSTTVGFAQRLKSTLQAWELLP